jgi:signal transduction histidine kinase
MGEHLFIASAIFSVANGSMVLWVNPGRLVNKVVFAWSAGNALWCLCVVSAIQAGHREPFASEATVFWLRASSIIAAFSIWQIWLLKSVLLKEHATLLSILAKSWAWFFVSFVLAMLSTSESCIPATTNPSSKGRGIAYLAYATTLFVCCGVLLADALRSMRQLRGVRKIEMQIFVIGAICACAGAVGLHASGRLLGVTWLRQASSVSFITLHGVIAWAVCYHRVFDAKQVIFSIGQRLLLLVTIGLSALLLNLLFGRFFSASWSLFSAILVASAIGIALDPPSRRWAGLDPERLLAAPRRQIIEWAREMSEETKLKEHFEQLLGGMCGSNSTILLTSRDIGYLGQGSTAATEWPGLAVLCKDGWTTPETLQRSRPTPGTRECLEFLSNHKLGALLAAPKGCRPPSLIIALGLKESLRPYTFPDIQVLLEVAQLMDNILTHSRVASQAAQVERIASMAMISRGLAHDLNSLASPVSAFLIHMEEKVAPGTVEATVLENAKSSLQVMQHYIQESLFFSRSLVPNFTPIKARALLNDAINLSLERARTINVSVVTNQIADHTFVGDLALLRRLLQNLVFNAIDASQEGETVKLSAEVAESGELCLRVADTGVGVPAEIRSRIFEPYFTTKNANNERRGLGLGLAISQKIVEIHGGHIGIGSNLPRGTIFTVTFPMKGAGIAAPPLPERGAVFSSSKPFVPISTVMPFKSSTEPNP